MYKKTLGNPIHIASGMSFNPNSNQAYQDWLAAGNVLKYSLEDAKLYKLAEIIQDRDIAAVADVLALGNTWQADKISQELLANAVRRAHAGKPLPPAWRTSDNINVPITDIAQLEEIEDAIAFNVQQAYSNSWARKAAVANATSAEEVELI